jgi:hypothetical protein
MSSLQQQKKKKSSTTRPDLALHGSESRSASATGESSQIGSERAFHTPASIEEVSVRSADFEPGSPGPDSSMECLENNNRVELSDTDGGQPFSSVFAAKIRQAVCQRTDTSNPSSSTGSLQELKNLSDIDKDKSELNTAAPDPADLVLPARKLADHLMAIYLTREYVNLPIFHLPDFQSKYVALWTGEDLLDDLGVFRGILNMIFALGSLATNPGKENEASIYFIRGQNLIRLGDLDGENISHIQAYLIASQYLLAVDNTAAAWKSVGLAIRLAQSFRLHLFSGSQHLRRREERELARRVWHSCLLMER